MSAFQDALEQAHVCLFIVHDQDPRADNRSLVRSYSVRGCDPGIKDGFNALHWKRTT
ncbi:MAG: hypothetical protein M3N48_13565 [Verrucomicrobiota bacterium]|nr:hypothetical protein [Verrucomicrobiota bacterium]